MSYDIGIALKICKVIRLKWVLRQSQGYHIFILDLCRNKLLAFSPVVAVNITFTLTTLMVAAQKCCFYE